METRKPRDPRGAIATPSPLWSPLALLRIGQTFAERYRVEGLLGGGRSSQVYEAVNAVDDRKVALKVFHPRVLPSPGAVKRFEYVMRVDRRLSGPHVVTTLDGGIDASTQIPFVVTELLSGETLEQAVRRRGAMSARRSMECLRQLAIALEVGHAYVDAAWPERGPVVHGTLKPASTFVSRLPSGALFVTLLDFGLAEALERSPGGLGPPAYAAYEQVCGFAVTPSADVWAFALVAFFMLTGHHYWYAASGDLDDPRQRRELFDEVLNRRFVPPSFRVRELGLDFELSPAFDAWFARCLDRQPEARFATAQSAFDELERALQPTEPARPSRLPVGSVRWLLGALVLGLVALVFFAAARPIRHEGRAFPAASRDERSAR
jgi:serine/threonine protein kinase